MPAVGVYEPLPPYHFEYSELPSKQPASFARLVSLVQLSSWLQHLLLWGRSCPMSANRHAQYRSKKSDILLFRRAVDRAQDLR